MRTAGQCGEKLLRFIGFAVLNAHNTKEKWKSS